MEQSLVFGQNFSAGPIPKSIDDLDQPEIKKETVRRVNGARVVYINYELLRHDFPQLRDESLASCYPELQRLMPTERAAAYEQKIDEWLIANTAFISESQARQAIVNSQIPPGHEQVEAFRPPKYGRSLVFCLAQNQFVLEASGVHPKLNEQGGLLDVKGVGTAPDKQPSLEKHRDGLVLLGHAFKELFSQELVQKIFRHSRSHFQTLPTYAILDLNFDVTQENCLPEPAAAIVRRAMRRPVKDVGAYGSDQYLLEIEMELLLRKYGVTSIGGWTRYAMRKKGDVLKVVYAGNLLTNLTAEELRQVEELANYKEGLLVLYGMNIQLTRDVDFNQSFATLVDFGQYGVSKRFKDAIFNFARDRVLRLGDIIHPSDARYVQPSEELCVSVDRCVAYSNHNEFLTVEPVCNVYQVFDGLAASFRKGDLCRDDIYRFLDKYLNIATSNWKLD